MIADSNPILPDHYFQTASRFPDVFRPRKADSHKGTYGTLGIIGGSEGMSGALVLAASAALYLGCGKVWAGFRQHSLPFAMIPERPEIMLATAEKLLQRNDITAWVAGCGLGLDEAAEQTLSQVLKQAAHTPLLLDADALTLLARPSENRQAAIRHPQLILTPHPAEAARLLNVSTTEIQNNRPQAAAEISQTFQAVTVLKGHHTLIAAPDGDIETNFSGNAGLATAGSGDVLSGIIGSLTAQTIDLWQATCAAVWLHGTAADLLKTRQGEIGMLAGEIAPAARWLRNRLITDN
ncbi:NAD(P)H-hydrate dehydratase [Neisseria sp. ZJ106]|uniref:ADP-dependent (S)-NAD(P)H-hydrate dehydratase n=1 Tax=Neisseria lisongii TaxID=2912188 RepID=A0ABY7RLM7_9NEIS|nr:NAD(P)H-hydrate dehydratase [Neisseria lisongii]MCF7521319.1 NAD(P)H-hydrate dehydratase [Neisseria lisongii]WCL72123.1 NAD(P)H-hydrate dehydratase [Neisseria lisongii]